MGTPYLGEIRMFGGNFAPVGWAFCDGQLLPIAQNDALFNLLGTTYGGDGQNTFALPDFRGRLPIHVSNSHPHGSSGGVEHVTLTSGHVPDHTHALQAVSHQADAATPEANLPADSGDALVYSAAAPNATMAPGAVAGDPTSQPHGNVQPFLCVNFIIALQGIFPSQA